MAAYFFDSSALVKRYVAETGSTRVISLLDPATKNRIYLAHTTTVLVSAAISRRVREGTLTVTAAQPLLNKFLLDVSARFQMIALDTPVVRRAVTLTEVHPLRAADAIQLATAVKVNDDRRAHGDSSLVLVCSDQSLLRAAVAEGLVTEDPTIVIP